MENKISAKKAVFGSFAALLILIAAQVLAGALSSLLLLIKVPEGICNIIAGILYLGFAYIFLQLFAKKILKIPADELGMSGFGIKWKWVAAAILLPLLVKMIYLLGFDGEYISSNMSNSEVLKAVSAGIFFTGIAAGFVEEMVFRGVILNLLKKKWNIKIAVIVPSAMFGIVHILGMDFSLISCLQVIIAGTMVGIMFSLIAIESGSVWNSAVVHAVWNMVIIGGGLAIGEKADEYSVMTYVLNAKAFAITGGEFGIESSVISLIAYIVVTGIALIMIKKKVR